MTTRRGDCEERSDEANLDRSTLAGLEASIAERA
jgi:hypothetical protein